MLHDAIPAGAIDAELIRVSPGQCSGPRRSESESSVLVVLEGAGSALAGDVWIEVKPGDRVVVGPGEPAGLRAGPQPIVAVLLRASASSAVRAA